jgi:hypothetical protein
VGPRTGLDDVKKKKSRPCRDSKSGPSTLQPVASRYSDCAIQTPKVRGTITFYRENQTQQTNTLSGENIGFLNDRPAAGG